MRGQDPPADIATIFVDYDPVPIYGIDFRIGFEEGRYVIQCARQYDVVAIDPGEYFACCVFHAGVYRRGLSAIRTAVKMM